VSLGEQRIAHKLNELVEMGVLEKDGRTKATKFRFRDPFAYIKERSQRRIDEYTKEKQK
jgi:hypothetical protein